MNGTTESFADEHEAFAASRVTQFVYVPTKESTFTILDQHADTLEGDVKPPLVLLGNEGSGKSALLANWVSKRREHLHRDEFLFQHFVGCTTPSLELSHTLFRLETALKRFFQLREMKVPDSEVELRWSLNRFLEAAAKKHSPARIVIIIDGINRLKAEGAPNGALHWLPTELPPCVRFIVSTVEFERNLKGRKEGMPHRTFVELARRQCPLLRIEPMDVNTRHSVINMYAQLHPESFELSESQQFKLVTAPSSAQPMYLRTLLQALRLASSLTSASVDMLMEKFLNCGTAHELIDKNLNICCQSSLIDDRDEEENYLTEMLGKMLSVVYVSRTGLSEIEIWGLMRLVSKDEPSEQQKTKLMTILKDFTMVVDNLHSFSHEIYREVIYQKYISSKNSLIRWHNVMAKYFSELGPCDRKLAALPYHLEMAGSWAKVKNCLTDIDMFQLWWTPKFKVDFIKFWASLTTFSSEEDTTSDITKKETRGTDGKRTLESSHSSSKKKRPSYDIVEEYIKSLDEYRIKKHPSDEAVADIILEIADFLLEFATLGHEQNADVPNLVHPQVLSEDLKQIGVPYIELNRDPDTGEVVNCSLVYPDILYSSNKLKSDEGVTAGGSIEPVTSTKTGDDVPICTAYFFFRWMWIQYPYIALGNCDNKYVAGINHKNQDMILDSTHKLKKLNNTMDTTGTLDSINNKNKNKNSSTMPEIKKEMSQSWSVDTFKLPELKFNRKAARSVPRVKHELEGDPVNAMNNKVQERITALHDSIQSYREEYDFVVQMKSIVAKRLQDIKDSLVDLERTAESCTQFDGELAIAMKRVQDVQNKYEKEYELNKNLVNLVSIINRHPANVPALITELQTKVEQDVFLIHEIKKRLWEQKFEKQTHNLAFRHMKKLVEEAVEMHMQLLEFNTKKYSSSKKQAMDGERELTQNLTLKSNKSLNGSITNGHSKSKLRKSLDKINVDMIDKELNNVNNGIKNEKSWEEIWSFISSKTGIIEPDAFFQRMNNASALVDQIQFIKRASESRLESLKKDIVTVEYELEEARNDASISGANGQSSKENKKELTEKQRRLKDIKEKAEGMEQLEQRVVAGLAHISDILFIPKSEEDTTPNSLVRDIEAVLDTLINEREKQQQQQGQSGLVGNSNTLPESHTTANRSPELDFVIAKHEDPKVRLPKRLPSRPNGGSVQNVGMTARSNNEDEEGEDEGMWDRTFAKTNSLTKLRIELKRAGKAQKDGKLAMLSTI
eukprot:gene6859-9393_t